MNNNLLVKVCGMTEADNIRRVEQLGVDFMGFVFYPHSPRFVHQLPGYLPLRAKRVGVFVDEAKENVVMYADRFGLDYVQLHGAESPLYCQSLKQRHGLKTIKAFHLCTPRDLAAAYKYRGCCDYLLFESKEAQPGGTGKQFDWNLLRLYTGTVPFILSGGIHPGSARAIGQLRNPWLAGIDLNSRFETSPGIKDVERLEIFLRELEKEGCRQPAASNATNQP